MKSHIFSIYARPDGRSLYLFLYGNYDFISRRKTGHDLGGDRSDVVVDGVSLDTLWIILPYSLSMAVVGILESLLTATVVDEMTDSKSDKNKEVKGQGIANMVTGFFGGMAGCAMIGQSVINVKSGGRTRLSTMTAGVFLLLLIMVLGDVVKQIPMAALVGVMIMVSFSTFDWRSLTGLGKMPRGDVLVMLVTVATVMVTHDLSKGVLAGVCLSAQNREDYADPKQYAVSGFGSDVFWHDGAFYRTIRCDG